eukprot:COSAG02_NODE_3892_length_6074_cov_5.045690_1_plen_83_part_00
MLMARVNGLGRLAPTPALNKTMLRRAAGGLEDPHLDRILYWYLYNKPSIVTVHSHSQSLAYSVWSGALRGGAPLFWRAIMQF